MRVLFGWILVALMAASACAAEERVAADITALQSAVEKGLAFLATRQADDGSFSTSGYGRNAAVCALGGMAWLSGGSTPDRGPYGEEVSRVTDFLLDHTEESGFISVDGGEFITGS